MLTSESCLQKFKEDYKHRLTEKTINLYERAVKQLLVYCEKSFDVITTGDIRKWLLHLDKINYKKSTVHTKVVGLKLFYKYCLEEKLVTNNPANPIPFPKIEGTLPCYLEMKELNLLRKLVEGKVQERAVVEVLYATGIRISEMAALKKEDISWSERIMHIRNGKRKKERIVPFTHTCTEHLKTYLEERKDDLPLVFVNTSGTGPICFETTQRKFKKYAKKLGVRMTPHTLRHTFAAHLAIKGMPLVGIQSLLGHDNPHHTFVYARLYSQAKKQKYDEWM